MVSIRQVSTDESNTRVRSKSAFEALTIRDAISTCHADVSNRKIYNSKSNNKIQILNAYETTSSFHIQIQIQIQAQSPSSWTHTQSLTLSKKVLILNIQFFPSDICPVRLVFACPLDLNQSKFQLSRKNGILNITLAKNTAELLSLTTFIREPTVTVFDSTTAKRWPLPRLANGRLLDVGLDFPGPAVVRGYDSETMIVHDAMTDMFTVSEFQLAQRQSGNHLQQDPDFDLRESIRQMYLYVFCGRQRLIWYTTKRGQPYSIADVRTCGDILFLYEGIYNFCGRPILAVSCLDMTEITDANVNYLTQYVKNLLRTELNIHASAMAQTRSVPQILPSDFNVMEILASKEELDLMRHFLLSNQTKTKGPHRNDLHGPWHASFIETLPSDSRSRFLSTQLTRENGVNLENVARNFFQCQLCKKTPSDPSKPWSKCGRCKKVNYCSKTCQVQDWVNHKKSCQH